MGGSLEYQDINRVYLQGRHRIKHPSIFIETGTYKGQTSLEMSKSFDHVYTIEISPTLFKESDKLFKQNQVLNITNVLGDSCEHLPQILKENKDKSIFFFLDAHYSYSETSWNQKELVPLITELKLINYHANHELSHVICIDDYRFFNNQIKEATDWSHITTDKVLDTMSGHTINNYFAYNDRFYIVLN